MGCEWILFGVLGWIVGGGGRGDDGARGFKKGG